MFGDMMWVLCEIVLNAMCEPYDIPYIPRRNDLVDTNILVVVII